MSGESANRQRRMPSAHELRIWRDFVETSELLRRRLGARMQAESGISSADYSVLLALGEAEGRSMRSSDLAEHIGWDRSRLSHHLGRMEKRGLIRRERCADDSRGSLVLLTREGAQRFRRGSVPHLRDVRELFLDALEPEQLTAVGEATAALRTHLQQPPAPGD
ncbi:MarR family winged helix-turn-helix transcriptional regulator [Gulosibacter sp. 10]|uniref:MarR family winged helix-turn-helix transcriptional regulator n=1 Tax=Gulosibacter sp. 10 TaxID=1255570 RepID=UPI00097E7D11|nr:MarR family transcriptional regulator [Gulosibacter sp. 10]SJM63432.1 Transcriptional regulator, MarR family [Gulosibacter sp. 10]